MFILAIDTAASHCNACVFESAEGRVFGEARLEPGRGHAELLLSVIEDALSMASIGYNDLDVVAVNAGPGSFTGIRVGVSAARGFALALEIPAIGISALEAIAFEAQKIVPHSPVCASLMAHRGAIFAQMFDSRGQTVSGPRAAGADEIAASLPKGCILAGSGSQLIAEAIIPAPKIILETSSAPDVVTIARIAALRNPPFEKPKPLYLRKPDAKVQTGFAVERTDR